MHADRVADKRRAARAMDVTQPRHLRRPLWLQPAFQNLPRNSPVALHSLSKSGVVRGRRAGCLSRGAQGLSGEILPSNITCGTEGNKPKSSCADLNPRIHALFRLLEGADGWAKPFWLHSTVASQPPSISPTARCKSGEVTLDHW
jgi:hypothetical protein